MSASTAFPRLAVAHLTALELAPPEWVRQAARAGFDAVGLRLNAASPGAIAYPCAVGNEGALPLAEWLDVLPAGTALGVEMPLPSLAVTDRLALAYRSTRSMLDAAHRRRELLGALCQ